MIIDEPNDSGSDLKEEEEEAGADIMVIGLFTAGGFLVILLIFICVLVVEKLRNARKRITEIVDLKPVDF